MSQHGQLSAGARSDIEEFCGAGVFGPVRGSELDLSEGLNLVVCSDGEDFSEIFDFWRRLCRGQCRRARVQPFTLLGGGYLLAEGSPVIGDHREDLMLLDHLRRGSRGRKIPTTVIAGQAPCLAANDQALEIPQAIAQLFRGKDRLVKEAISRKAACVVHVNFGCGKREAYHLSRKRWEAWRARKH